jgi:hypothetical protein
VAWSLEAGDELAAAYGRAQRSLTLTRRSLAGISVDPAEIADLIGASAAVFERHDDHFGAGSVRTIEAVGLLAGGDLRRSERIAHSARVHALRCGDRFVQGRVAWIEGLLADAAGDVPGAYRHVERGLLLLDELGMGQEVTVQAALLVALAERQGEQELASQWRAFVAGRSGGLARHDVLLVASSRNREGLAAREAGELARARTAHLQALTGYEQAGITRAVAFTLSCLGFLSTEMGEEARAAGYHAAAFEAATAAGEAGAIALALEGAAAAYGDGRSDWAATMLGAASRLRGESADHHEESHRRDVAAVADRARHELGASAFEASYRRGGMLGRDEALDAARTVLGDTTSAPGEPRVAP